jgi:outer membrane protein assembly factor BamD (BamD/ComL family)
LEEVIYYEDIAQVNDSILGLIRMSEEEQLAYFKSFTDDLKEKAEKKKEQEEIANRLNSGLALANNLDTGPQRDRLNLSAASEQQKFYFYNQTTVAFGKNEFVKIWGDRSLKDNWRLSNSNIPNRNQQVNAIVANATEEELYDPQFYISKIPTEQKSIDSLSKDRNYAYYQLGVIYKEKFNELELAKDKLQELLKSNPEERLVLPAKYHLYKIYSDLKLSDEAEIAKSDIITNYPESKYAELLLNPKAEVAKDENSPESLYEKLYAEYQNQNYADVIRGSEDYIRQFEGEIMVPKFEILKASAKGRLFGFESYKEGINYLALNYPNSLEGKKAQEILEFVIPSLEKKPFIDDASANNSKAIYQFDNGSNEDIDAFQKQLNEEIVKIRYFELSSSKDVYNKNTTFIVVHGFKTIEGAKGFSDLLEERKSKIIRSYFAISSPNYEIIQMHKNLDEYLNSQ